MNDRPTRQSLATRVVLVAALTGLGGLLSGCLGAIGPATDGFMRDKTMVSMLQGNDMDMACSTGRSFAAVVWSLSELKGPDKAKPRKAAMIAWVTAGMCAEVDAWEADLERARWEYARKEYAGSPGFGASEMLDDSLVAAGRAHRLAAIRFERAWQFTTELWGDPSDPEWACPKIHPKEEVLYLLGMASGVLAIFHDGAAGVDARMVSLDMAPAAAKGSKCLDSDAWWGVPSALQGAVYSSIPGEWGADPRTLLDEAATLGDSMGVSLSRAFQALGYANLGDTDAVNAAMDAHNQYVAGRPWLETLPDGTANPDFKENARVWRTLDLYGHLTIRQESDRCWTRLRGSRTSEAALSCPTQRASDDPLDTLPPGLFDGLLPEPETPEPAAEETGDP